MLGDDCRVAAPQHHIEKLVLHYHAAVRAAVEHNVPREECLLLLSSNNF